MSSDVVVEYEVEDRVATITLNRPHRKNALSIAMTPFGADSRDCGNVEKTRA